MFVFLQQQHAVASYTSFDIKQGEKLWICLRSAIFLSHLAKIDQMTVNWTRTNYCIITRHSELRIGWKESSNYLQDILYAGLGCVKKSTGGKKEANDSDL